MINPAVRARTDQIRVDVDAVIGSVRTFRFCHVRQPAVDEKTGIFCQQAALMNHMKAHRAPVHQTELKILVPVPGNGCGGQRKIGLIDGKRKAGRNPLHDSFLAVQCLKLIDNHTLPPPAAAVSGIFCKTAIFL